MIHEIILSLIGQTGDIIILTDKKKKNNHDETNINIDQYCFEVNNNIHIFLNAEIKVINEIVELGYYFYIINTFCLLVKKNTIYKNLTHVHRFNKLNEERKDPSRRNGNKAYSSSSSSSVCSSVSSSSDSYSNYSENEREKKEDEIGCDKDDGGRRETKHEMTNDELREEAKRTKRRQVDDYFGVVLKNVKTMNHVKPCGYYANGIYNETQKFIKSYLRKISEIEEFINNNNSTPLTQILSMLEKKREELIIIVDIIKNYLEFQKKEEQNVMEGESRSKTKELIDYLYDNCLSGNSRIKNIYYKYFKSLGKILLHQICSWILYGQLIDPYYEFFVQKRQFIYTDDRKIFLSPEELYENLFLTNVQSLNFEWNYLFFQSLSNMPECCIDKGTGRRILFIGKSVRILIRSNRWTTQDVTSLFPIIKILSKAFTKRETQNKRKGIRNRKIVTPYDLDRGSTMERVTDRGEEISSSDLSDSSSYSDEESTDVDEEETLNLYCKEIFDITIEKIRRIIAYKLWKYIVRDVNLIKIFDLYKDIYLLNSGDFYEYFFEKSWSLMHTPPNTKNEILLKNFAWKNASIQVEDYFRINYENNKKEKLKLDLYEENFIDRNNNSLGYENEFHFFSENRNSEFNVDTSENVVSKYFYPRVSYKTFFYDSFVKGKLENLILGGMAYIEENKIVLNHFYTGIKNLSKKKYYDYDNIFSVCINNYRQQILKGFKHGFDFSVNFNNFFDNRIGNMNVADNHVAVPKEESGLIAGACFALVMHSVKKPLLYKTEVLESELGYWGNLGDCLSVEIKVKFFRKNRREKNESDVDSINNMVPSVDLAKENDPNFSKINKTFLGDVEVEVSLFIGGKGISSFVHNHNNFSADYSKESILYRKLLEGKRHHQKFSPNEEDPIRNINGHGKAKKNKNTNNFNYEENKRNDNRKSRTPVLKIQSNKQVFSNVDKNSITKFRVRVNCLKHSFSVYLQKLDEYNATGNVGEKNKIKPIIYIRALDMTQAFSLDIGNAYIGFYTCPVLFKHKLLKQKKKLEKWFQKFYNETLQPDSNIYNKQFFNVENEKDKQLTLNDLNQINKIILYNNSTTNNNSNNKRDVNFAKLKNKKSAQTDKCLLFSSYDCCVEIHQWFHQSYKSPIEMPDVNEENEILIFYDKEAKKNIRIHSGLNNWNNIEIYFKLTWPIALIINTNTIYTYNAIFQFRFLLGRIYYNLKILCYHNRQLVKYLNSKKGFFLFSHLFSIRYKMQFFFFQLIRYLQEDIINYEYKLMKKQIHKSKDFEYTKSVHDLYISQIATKCFLRVHELTTPLIELIDICFKFCYFFQCLIENELFVDILSSEQNDAAGNNDQSNGLEDDDDDLKQVVEKLLQYNETFDEKFTIVLNEMTNISLNTNQSHLVHLLTILDYNNYATKIKDSVRKKKAPEQEAKSEICDTKKKTAQEQKSSYVDGDIEDENINDMRYASYRGNNEESIEYLQKLRETKHITDKKDITYQINNPPYNSMNILNETNFSSKSITHNTRNIFDMNTNLTPNRVFNNFGNLINNNNMRNNNSISNSNIFPNANESVIGLNSARIQRNRNEIEVDNFSIPVVDNIGNNSLAFGMENNITNHNLMNDDVFRSSGMIGKEMGWNRMNDISKYRYDVNNKITEKYVNPIDSYGDKNWMNHNEQSVMEMNNDNIIISNNHYKVNNIESIGSGISGLDIGSLSNLNFTTDSDLLEKNDLLAPKFPINMYNNTDRIDLNFQQPKFQLGVKQRINRENNLLERNGSVNYVGNNEIKKNKNVHARGIADDTDFDKYYLNKQKDINSRMRSGSTSTMELKIKNNFNIRNLLDNYNYHGDNNVRNKYKGETPEKSK